MQTSCVQGKQMPLLSQSTQLIHHLLLISDDLELKCFNTRSVNTVSDGIYFGYVFFFLLCRHSNADSSSPLCPQWSGSGTGSLRETAALQPAEVQLLPLRPGSV